jgi:hypothetical protein
LVTETGIANIHAGEVIANQTIMENIGKGLHGMRTDYLRGVTNSIGAQLSSRTSGGDTHMHLEANNWYGNFTQEHANSIMNTAVRELRQASRTWAFNPTGS